MNTQKIKWLGGLAACLTLATHADTVLFQDNFESGNLNQWTAKPGQVQHGQIVADPLQPANHVLTFTDLNTAGDILTVSSFSLSGTQRLVLSFDYLGWPLPGSVAGDLGGFIGIATSLDTALPHFWLAGTDISGINTPPGIGTELIDDGTWHHYDIDFTDFVQTNGPTTFHLVVEDWADHGGVPGDAFFDNIRLTSVGGTSLEDLVPCSGPLSGGTWKNHGQYVSTVSRVTRDLVRQGVITRRERSGLVSSAARSDCGKKPHGHGHGNGNGNGHGNGHGNGKK